MVIQDRCVICNIVAGKIPAWIVYRDADVICFLPKTLEAYGHTLIASKEHYSDIFSIPENLLEIEIATAKKLAIHYCMTKIKFLKNCDCRTNRDRDIR
jgi:histidine triad (HIT) family protein